MHLLLDGAVFSFGYGTSWIWMPILSFFSFSYAEFSLFTLIKIYFDVVEILRTGWGKGEEGSGIVVDFPPKVFYFPGTVYVFTPFSLSPKLTPFGNVISLLNLESLIPLLALYLKALSIPFSMPFAREEYSLLLSDLPRGFDGKTDKLFYSDDLKTPISSPFATLVTKAFNPVFELGSWFAESPVYDPVRSFDEGDYWFGKSRYCFYWVRKVFFICFPSYLRGLSSFDNCSSVS